MADASRPGADTASTTQGTGPKGSRARWWGAAGLAVLVAAAGAGFTLKDRFFEPEPLPRHPAQATVTVRPDQPLNTFPGVAALGAGIDGLEKGEIDKVWTQENLDLMKSAGFGPLSFRLRTELGIKAWHWHSEGTWSDPAKKQGYWTGNPTSGADPGVTYGYSLPRRGNTIDQAGNDGYSRLTDGDQSSYWKSNPYLDPHFTKKVDAAHPQWVVVAFNEPTAVDTLKIAWGAPFARTIKVQRWEGSDGALFPIGKDSGWRDVPTTDFTGTGGTQTARFAPSPITTEYVRILLSDPSGTAEPGSTDVRDSLGFAIRELQVGRTTGGSFVDAVTHKADNTQTRTYTSSTDPWHRETDLDGRQEHASFKRVFESGLTKDKPLMVPVPVLYGVPEDAGNLLRYLRQQGYPVTQIEMGEEPDGQHAEPEHYAALYEQVADSLKSVDDTIQMGGPGYQTVLPNWVHWPDASGNRSWTGRFVNALKASGRMDDFDFFSFEWYPFDDVCADPAKPIAQNPKLLEDIVAKQREAGLPQDMPMVITELGYSAFADQPEVELPGAILNAESSAKFLQLGGQHVYFYGLEPNWVFQEEEGKSCNTWGNLMLFQFFDDFRTRPIATYYGARMLTGSWVSGEDQHTLIASGTAPGELAQTTPARDGGDLASVVTSYAVERPDGRLSVMLFNKDPRRPVTVRLESDNGDGARVLRGELQVEQYSPQQYQWDPTPGKDSHGRPTRNDPPVQSMLPEAQGAIVTLPPYSINVVTATDDRAHSR